MATSSICSVDDCGKPTHKRGKMCSMHMERVRKHGNPNAGAFQPKGKCTIDGCDRVHSGRGYCLKHYKRFVKYGDPFGGSTDWGAAQDFIRAAVLAGTDDCIIFPYYRNADGYGWMRFDGRNLGSHVVAAILAHGPKPTPKHEACHTCGKGHEGCVNPKHIYWGTRADNTRDSYAHGARDAVVYRTGESAAAAKYTDAQIAAVRDALESGETQTSVARRMGMSQSHVNRIKYGARGGQSSKM